MLGDAHQVLVTSAEIGQISIFKKTYCGDAGTKGYFKLTQVRLLSRQKGEFVFEEGNESYVAYIINEGSVEIFVGRGENKKSLLVLGKGEMFGEMGIVSDAPRSASAYCLSDCQFTLIDRYTIEDKINSSDPYIKYLIRFLMDRVKSLSSS